MRKNIILFSLLLVFVLSGCSNKKTKETKEISEDSKIKLEQTQPEIRASAQVGYIDFEAVIITPANFDDLSADFDVVFDRSTIESVTQILLTGNNHRSDLSVFDYQELSTLDGALAQKWEELSNGMSGHHIAGVITFSKNNNPKSLIIAGLPVGDAILTF